MVTNYPQQLTAAGTGRERSTESLAVRAATKLGQLLCGVRGHETVMHFEDKRVMMRCTSCGHDTPGWEVSERGPRQRFDGDRRRHSMSSPTLVLRKSA